MLGCGIELSTRADGADLPPGGLGTRPVEVLHAEAEKDTWRIIEIFSRIGAPFEVDLSWSSGSGTGASAKITVAHAARIGIFARALRLTCRNLFTKINRVGVTVADGAAQTHNVWEARGATGIHQVWSIKPPPFADRFRIEFSNPAALVSAEIRLVDGLSAWMSTVLGPMQPSDGIPVGGAHLIQVESPDLSEARAVFSLRI